MIENSLDERALFLAALEKATRQEREAFLKEACTGDLELLQRVRDLLQCHDESVGPLDSPPFDIDATATDRPIAEQPGDSIGPYKLLQQIGEGGMGVVFMAEQTEPIHRTVALKIIKPGMDTRQVIARFEAERQALAMMDHPNIAKVLDAGTTDSGRPYFVMELVKGVPITKYCDEKQLSLRDRIDLFTQVCHAVQHAHQKGVIHRDIKPTNVLVAEYDNRAVPKVIDFGVVKATAQKLTERTMFTEFGQVVGTVEYMSPEQAKLNQLDIDTRTDIYSLGVLLYELLTGSTPFEQKQLREAAFDEMLRIIREEEPPKPSTRLSTSDTLPSIAANRHTEPQRLSKEVSGELDWIVMKALEKDRNRRYETASAIAADIERHLRDEPVQAGPPSAAYRLRKFARRNKATLVMAALVVAFVLAGLVLLAVNNMRLKAEQARTRAETKRAQGELVRADGNLTIALQALDEVYLKEIESRGYQRRELTPADREVLQKGLDFYQQFAEHNAGHVALREEVAKAHRRLGSLWRELGKLHEAQEAFARAIPVFQSLLAQAPDAVKYRRELASCLLGLSVVLRDAGQRDEAEEPSRRSLALWETVIADPSSTRHDRLRFGHSLWHRGMLDSANKRYEVAERHFMRALDLFRTLSTEFPDERYYRLELAFSHYCLFEQICIPTARNEEAKAHAQEAINIYQRLAGETADNERYLRDWAYMLKRLAALLAASDRAEEAQKLNRQAVEVQEKLVEPYRIEIARRPNDPWTHHTLADVLANQGRFAEAEAEFREALRLDSNNAGRHHNLGDALMNQGKYADAAPEYGEAIRLQPDLADSWAGRGGCRRQMGEFAKMIEDYSHAIELQPSKQWYWHERAYAYLMLGEHEKSIADHSKSIELGDQGPGQRVRRGRSYRALGQLQKAGEDFSRAIELSPSHWEGWYQRARLYHQQHEPEKAQADFANATKFANDPGAQNEIAWSLATDPDPSWRNPAVAVELAEKATAARPADGLIWNTFGAARYRNGQWKEAIAAFEKSMELHDGGDSNDWFFLAMCHWQLGDKQAARKWHDQAVVWMNKNEPKNDQLRRFRTEAEELLKITDENPTTKPESK